MGQPTSKSVPTQEKTPKEDERPISEEADQPTPEEEPVSTPEETPEKMPTEEEAEQAPNNTADAESEGALRRTCTPSFVVDSVQKNWPCSSRQFESFYT